jgi:carbon-monoxide dehydrogenase medium subunit
MYPFEYRKAASLKEAESLLRQTAGAKPIAGGMSLVPGMRHRLIRVPALIDLNAIEGLGGIKVAGGTVTIGAMTRHAAVAASREVKAAIPALATLAGGIGDPLVRNRGTIGGSLANNDPAACYPSALLGLESTVVTNRRRIRGDDFITGMFETALEADEIITAVEFRQPRRAAYVKFANYSSRFSIVGVFVSRSDAGVRVGVTGAGSHAFRAGALEQALTGDFSPSAIENLRIDSSGLGSDLHASAEYRAHLIRVLTQTAVQEAT